ncbi:uncharacterized protein FIBRA_02605 [Fibroporia radiculosa]|uniref:DDH domain-containing protein n=1 Tax=Fibroporia radiculosa TaxID=599839 RepID=J4I955_9APHY|nr:uncharacterized protein FIBRA_02605 [Fibroporia radiculosa]CCM00571.1 predicted protein [Fibroporia radiculosa]
MTKRLRSSDNTALPVISNRSPEYQSEGDGPGVHSAQQWPVSKDAMSAARTFLQECASARQPTLLLPDKDADGLCSGLILYHTLCALGLPPQLLTVHFVAKGSNVHAPDERAQLASYQARYLVLVDQGSRPGPPIVDSEEAKVLIVDHHASDSFPANAQVLSAAGCEPVATSSTLAYLLCRPLVASADSASSELKERLEYLCVMGTMGDLGAGFKWEAPFPDMRVCMKRWTKKALAEAVSLLNAPRRTARYDVIAAWDALMHASSPRELVSSSAPLIKRLHAARDEVRREVERCTHTAPMFSGDGRVALIRISSTAQVHPLIATRWAATLKSARLEMVMCANDGYLPGEAKTNFACRIARCALTRGQTDDAREIDVMEMLKQYASHVLGLQSAMGEDFARGHRQASGGIVMTAHFERLWNAMKETEPEIREAGPSQKKRKAWPSQGNTLESWLRKT